MIASHTLTGGESNWAGGGGENKAGQRKAPGKLAHGEVLGSFRKRIRKYRGGAVGGGGNPVLQKRAGRRRG